MIGDGAGERTSAAGEVAYDHDARRIPDRRAEHPAELTGHEAREVREGDHELSTRAGGGKVVCVQLGGHVACVEEDREHLLG